jgi:hypothetical protein
MTKPFSQSCENNKQPILQVIQSVFNKPVTVWEIGSGTGQHACYFAQNLPHITWQTTDREENRQGLDKWIEEANLINLPKSLKLNVTNKIWPCQQIEALFTANTLHIMHWQDVENLFSRLKNYLSKKTVVCICGPFNYNGQYTSPSNEEFNQWLKMRDPESGIRDFEAIERLAKTAELMLKNDHQMPANNRLLIFQKNVGD